MREWRPLTSCTSALWASLLRSYLEGRGIRVWVENEHIHSVFGGIGISTGLLIPALGALKIWVHKDQFEEAQETLREFFEP